MKKYKVILASILTASILGGCAMNMPEATGNTVQETIHFAFPIETTAETTVTVKEPETFTEMYGDQIQSYLNHTYYFDGKEISAEESNFYFINSFIDLTTYAQLGYYPLNAQGFIDLAAEYDGDKYKTYGDYFVSYAESNIQRTYILNKYAKDIPDTIINDIDVDNAVNSMKEEGQDFNKYLQLYYGPTMTEETFKDILSRYYMADAYAKYYCDHYNFTDEEKVVPNIRFALFYAPGDMPQVSKDNAKAKATELLNSCKSIEDLKTLCTDNKDVYDFGDVSVSKGEMVETFEMWAYQSHEVGDMDVIYCSEYGYFVVGYLGTIELSAENLEYFALQDLNNKVLEDINNKTYEFYTNMPYYPAVAIATPTPTPTEFPIPPSTTTETT